MPNTTECAETVTLKNTTYTCTLPAGHEDAHENSEHEVAWGTNL